MDVEHSRVQSHGGGHGFEGGAHFICADADTIDAVRLQCVGGNVGVEIRQRNKREHLPIRYIHYQPCPRDSFETGDGFPQFIAQCILNPQIQTENNRFEISSIEVQAGGSKVLESLFVDPAFDAGDSGIVYVDRPQDMRSSRPIGIKTPCFIPNADTWNSKCPQAILFSRRYATLDPGKSAVAGQALVNIHHVEVGKDARQAFSRLVDIDNSTRLGVNRTTRNVHGKGNVIAIDNIRSRYRWRNRRVSFIGPFHVSKHHQTHAYRDVESGKHRHNHVDPHTKLGGRPVSFRKRAIHDVTLSRNCRLRVIDRSRR